MGARGAQVAICLALLGLHSALGAVQGGGEVGPECEDVTHLPPGEDRCAFVLEYCVQHSYFVYYLKMYYCHISPHGAALSTLVLVTCVCVLALLFRLMARTADDFFACILSQISQDMGLPPRLGGVTLLALGNGAPDLSACIAAVKTGNYRMALGALTGAGMFVGCVVAGRILTLNAGAKARWAQIRDVFFYLLAVATVTGIFASGRFTYDSVLALLLLYAGYVVVVAVADFTKRHLGVEWPDVPRQVARSLSQRLSFRRGRSQDLGAPLLRGIRSPSPAYDQLSDVADGPFPAPHETSPFAQGPYIGSDDERNSTELLAQPSRHRSSLLHSALQNSSEGLHSQDRLDTYLQQQAAASHSGPPPVTRQAHSLPPNLPRPPSMHPHVPAATPVPRLPTFPSERADSAQIAIGIHAMPGGREGSFGRQPSLPASGSGSGERAALPLPLHRGFTLPSWLHLHRHSPSPQGSLPEPARRGFTVHHPDLHLRDWHLPGWLGLGPHDHPRRHHHTTHELHAAHARRVPPVAAFQPRVPYSDLVRMPAAEYRRRALAEMAQSRSFMVRGRGGRVEEVEEEEEEEEESGSERGSEAGSGYALDAERGYYAPPVLELEGPNGQSPEGQPMHDLHLHLEKRRAEAEAAAAAAAPAQRQLDAARGEAAELAEAEAAATSAAATVAAAAAAAAAAAVAGAEEKAGVPPLVPPAQLQQVGEGQQQQRELKAEAQRLVREAGPRVSFADAPAPPSTEAAPRLPPPVERHHTHYAQYEFEGGGAAGAGLGAGAVSESEAATEAGPPGLFSRMVAVVEAPFMKALQVTVPLVEPTAYQRRWFIASMACSPLFILLYLQLLGSWRAWLAALCSSAGLAATAVLGTRALGEQAPLWSCGLNFPVGAALVAVYGFGVAAMWISLFAGEIVALLHFLGTLSGIDSGVLGLTVLAWGNSLMDLINNTSMAGKSAGGNSMAMTACYAGPLFNMLIGLGLGFWSLLSDTGESAVGVVLPLNAGLGFGAIMVVCAALIWVALANNHWLPQRFGWAMIGWYATYLTVILLVTVL